METIGTKIKEGADAMGDMIVATVGSWMDRGQAALMEKGGELMGGIGSAVSDSIGSAKHSIGESLSPNSIGQSKGPSNTSPAIEKTPTRAPEASPSHDSFGTMLQDAGVSMESLQSIGAHVTDLGNASVGIDGVGCASHDAPRVAAITQQQLMAR